MGRRLTGPSTQAVNRGGEVGCNILAVAIVGYESWFLLVIYDE